MKIELNVVGLTQHLDFTTGAVTCTAVAQNAAGDILELPVSEAFAENLTRQHLATAGLPATRPGQLQGTKASGYDPRQAAPVEVVETGLEAQVADIINAVEENQDYAPTEAEFEVLARAGIDLVALVQDGSIVPGSRAPADEPRVFGMDTDEGPSAPSLGSLFGSDAEDAEKELTATQKTIADLKTKARRAPRAPRTVPHDEAGNPIVEQRPQVTGRKGGSGDDLFSQG